MLGVKVAFKSTTSQVVGRFKDSTPAAVVHELGSGRAVYVGAFPGLSYLKDAGFVPAELKEQYPRAQRHTLAGLAAARGLSRLVELSHPVVEAGIYDAPVGTALVLANFTYRPIEMLTVQVPMVKPVRAVRSVEQGALAFNEEPVSPTLKRQGYRSVVVFRTRLELNDVVLFE